LLLLPSKGITFTLAALQDPHMKTHHHQTFSERSPAHLKPRYDRLAVQAKRRAATRRLEDFEEQEFFRI
jgi:hypothetical protein